MIEFLPGFLAVLGTFVVFAVSMALAYAAVTAYSDWERPVVAGLLATGAILVLCAAVAYVGTQANRNEQEQRCSLIETSKGVYFNPCTDTSWEPQ